VTVAVIWLPTLRFVYHAPAARVALESAAALIALLAAYLMLGRFLQGHRLRELALAIALAVLSLTNLLVAGFLLASPDLDTRLLATGGSLVGAVLIAVAAYVPRESTVTNDREVRLVLAGAAVLVAGVAVLLAGLNAVFPLETATAANTHRPAPETNVPLLVGQLLAMGAYAYAAIGFSYKGRIEQDSFLVLMGVASTLGAFARLHYVLFGPVHSGLVHTGDIFRVLFYLVLLVAAAREIEQYWRGLERAAVLEERQRLSRELHDGVAQELAFISVSAKRSLLKREDDIVREISASAERGLADSRRAIAALTSPLHQPLEEVLAEAVREAASRHEVGLELEVGHDLDLDAETREALVGIASEAISNAARHGHASAVRVSLLNGDRLRFTVSDDGTGFDTSLPKPGRFGIAIMRDRANAVGGSFDVSSAPGRGTRVEVVLP
jgi:signal transduction histidine kinase